MYVPVWSSLWLSKFTLDPVPQHAPDSFLHLRSFSFSESLIGFFAQVTLAIVILILAQNATQTTEGATRTTEIVLLPTKCVLSNNIQSFPYLIVIGYVTIILASAFVILRAHGFQCSSAQTTPDPTARHPFLPSRRQALA